MFNVGDVVFVEGELGVVDEIASGIYLVDFGTDKSWCSSEEMSLHPQKQWNSPTIAEVESIVTNMPEGLEGFLKGWGWLQFAREVEKLCQEKNT